MELETDKLTTDIKPTGNDYFYLLSHTTTRHHEQDMSNVFTNKYLSTIPPQVETIKIEEIEGENKEDENTHTSVNIMNIEVVVPLIKNENLTTNDTLESNSEFDRELCKNKKVSNDQYEGHLNQHGLTQEVVKPLVCNICDKRFTRSFDLKRHKLTHEGIKPFECDQCEKGFTQTTLLKTHKLSHEGIKPFTCDKCDKRFTHSSNLKRHKLSHDGIKPFACDICNKRFTHNCYLKTHKLIHEGIKPFATFAKPLDVIICIRVPVIEFLYFRF